MFWVCCFTKLLAVRLMTQGLVAFSMEKATKLSTIFLTIIFIWLSPAFSQEDFITIPDTGKKRLYISVNKHPISAKELENLLGKKKKWPAPEYYKIYKNENEKFYNYLLKKKKRSEGKIFRKTLFKKADKYNVVLKKLPPFVPKIMLGFTDKKLHNLETLNIYLKFYILDFSNFEKKIQNKKITKFLSDSNYQTKTTKEDILEDIKLANNIWNGAGVTFFTEVKTIEFIFPKVTSHQKDMIWMTQNCNSHISCLVKPKKKSELADSNYIKQHFIYRKITNSAENYTEARNLDNVGSDFKGGLINVYYLPRMLSEKNCGIASSLVLKNKAWNDHRKDKHYIVIGHECGNSIRGKTLAHELGHIFGLKHVNDKNNMMYPFITGKKKLTVGQSVNSRLFYKSYGLK